MLIMGSSSRVLLPPSIGICYVHPSTLSNATVAVPCLPYVKMLPVVGSAHDNGLTMVRAEYGNTEGSLSPKD
jgi:hypothetical protein